MNKFLILISICALLVKCDSNPEIDLWRLDVPIYGSNSSPKCVDLNRDGIKDIVIGTGKNEFDFSEIGVLAVDGKTGKKIWSIPAKDQVYGSPIFQDINLDSIPEVYITGRSQNFFCIDGATGEIIWKYTNTANDYTPAGLARFNFYNPRFVEDLNDDGFEDLLVVNSGNIEAKPFESKDRHPGVLMVLDSKTGDVLSLDTIRDGKESYMSPIVYDFNKDGKDEIVFGTGGETISGNLHIDTYEHLLKNDLSNSKIILSSKNNHGYVAPPLIADFTNDGFKDLLVTNHGGVISLLDGKNNLEVIWNLVLDELELNAMPTIGNFDGDEFLDIFISGAKGQWPENTGSVQLFINGKNGQIIKKHELGCSGFSSPITINIDEKGNDETLLFVNEFECSKNDLLKSQTSLYVFSPIKEPFILRSISYEGKNVSSTLWAGDLDADQQLDIISLYFDNVRISYEFLGLHLQRDEFPIHPKHVKWGEYMGNGNLSTY